MSYISVIKVIFFLFFLKLFSFHSQHLSCFMWSIIACLIFLIFHLEIFAIEEGAPIDAFFLPQLFKKINVWI